MNESETKQLVNDVVTDVDISFGNMYMLMIKATFAFIFAQIVIWGIAFALFAFTMFVVLVVVGS